MKKKLNVIFNIVIPTTIGYATFFLIFYFFQKLYYEYRWLAVIPFTVVTAFFIKENMREWMVIKQHS